MGSHTSTLLLVISGSISPNGLFADFGYWANGNQVRDIMMNQIGKFGYYLVNASENTISGGFISGGPANMTVIKS